MEIEVTPIRKNQGLGKVTEHDASVVIGNSKPDFIENTPVNSAENTVKSSKNTVKSSKNTVKSSKNTVKSSKNTKNSGKQGKNTHVEATMIPSGNQLVTKKKPFARERVTFTPNKHIKQLIKEIEAKYGSMGKSEFINVAIEAEFNRRK